MASTYWQQSFSAIGTTWQLDVWDAPPTWSPERFLSTVHSRVEEFDRHYSRFRSDGWIAELARESGLHTLPQDASPLLQLYEELYHSTQGRFTPFIGETLEDAGYDAQYSLRPNGTVTKIPQWSDVVAQLSECEIHLHQPALFDFGAAGKGYLVDILVGMLSSEGVSQYCVDGSGDIAVKRLSDSPLRVGLEHPLDSQLVIGVAEISQGSLAASGTSRRTWGEYHHIIDARTARPTEHVLATWVHADTTLLADALATALFLVEPSRLDAFASFEYVIVYDTMKVRYSPNFPGELFIKSSTETQD